METLRHNLLTESLDACLIFRFLIRNGIDLLSTESRKLSFILFFQFAAEFRRFSISKTEASKYETFKEVVEQVHKVADIPFTISYIDPRDNDLLPINNDDNLARALLAAKPLLRLVVQRKGFLIHVCWLYVNYVLFAGESLEELNGYGTFKPKNIISSIFATTPGKAKTHLPISNPHDFRQVGCCLLQAGSDWGQLRPGASYVIAGFSFGFDGFSPSSEIFSTALNFIELLYVTFVTHWIFSLAVSIFSGIQEFFLQLIRIFCSWTEIFSDTVSTILFFCNF